MDPRPYIRLWQSFCIQALSDAMNGSREAKLYIQTDMFRELCVFLGLNEAAITSTIRQDGPDKVWERFKKARRTGSHHKG